MSHHINQYPYNAGEMPLLFRAPSRQRESTHDNSSRGSLLSHIPLTQWNAPAIPGPATVINTEVHGSASGGDIPVVEYKQIPRGTARAHPQKTQKVTTVSRQSHIQTSTNIVTINSADRNRIPRLTLGRTVKLQPDSLVFTNGSQDMIVHMSNHGLHVDENITLTGASTQVFVVNQPFETRSGTNIVRIEITSGHTLSDDYRMSDNLFVEISNVSANLASIAANLINGVHKVYLVSAYSDYPGYTSSRDTISYSTNSRYIYIQIPREATEYYLDRLTPADTAANMGVMLEFRFISGIPLYYINTGFPRSLVNYDQYLRVSSIVDENTFTVQLRQMALQTSRGGGEYMQLSTVKSVAPAYPEASQYVISLPKEYTNVVRVDIVGCAFPYSGYVVRNTEPEKNNTIYWQVLDDLTATRYSASITRGNYDTSEIALALENAMNVVRRADTGGTHKFTVAVSSTTNTITFRLQDSHKLKKALIFEYLPAEDLLAIGSTYLYVIDPGTNASAGDSVNISHTNTFSPVPQLALQGDFTIESVAVFSDFDAVALSALTKPAVQGELAARKRALITLITNLGYTVKSTPRTLSSGVIYPIVTLAPDFYSIPITEYESEADVLPTEPVYSGMSDQTSTIVTAPAQFRLLFNMYDTIGSVIGFRNVGDSESVTGYSTVIKNTDLYEYETMLNMDPVIGSSTGLNLAGDRLIHICCPQLSSIQTTAISKGSNASGPGTSGGVSNIFATLYLDGHPGCTLFNTHIHTPKIFSTTLTSLAELDISIVTPSGRPYDFNGHDHSFTISITQVHGMPHDVQFNSNTGQLAEELPDTRYL